MHFGSTFLAWLRMMLVGIWLGLYWVFFFLRSLYSKLRAYGGGGSLAYGRQGRETNGLAGRRPGMPRSPSGAVGLHTLHTKIPCITPGMTVSSNKE